MPKIAELPKQQRQGSFQSASHSMRENAQGAVRVLADLDDADIVTPGNVFRLHVYRLEPGGGGWVHVAGAEFHSGPHHNPADPEWEGLFVATDAGALAGKMVRAEIEVVTRSRVGCALHHD